MAKMGRPKGSKNVPGGWKRPSRAKGADLPRKTNDNTCKARCHCNRRCHKTKGHWWSHHCLWHGNF